MRGDYSSEPGSQEWQSHSVPLGVTHEGDSVRSDTPVAPTWSCRDPVTATGWVTPPGCPGWWPCWMWEALGSPDKQLRALWLFRARLDLASLSKGVEARAGALKVFTGMLACLQVSEWGRVPFKSPWKDLLLWGRKQRLPAGENRFVKELWRHSLVPGSRPDMIPIIGRTREEDYPENTGAWC